MDQSLDPRWLLVEEGFTLAREHEIETLFAIGNGASGSRGSLEEGSDLSSPATFLAGVFFRPETSEAILEPDSIPELVTFPNWGAVQVRVNGSLLRMDQGEVLTHQRILDMKHGVLHRDWRQSDPDGRVTHFRSIRIASLADRRLLLQQVLLTAENYRLNLVIESSMQLGPRIELRLPEGWKPETRAVCPSLLPFVAVLEGGEVAADFCVASQLRVDKASQAERQVERKNRCVVETIRVRAGAGTQCELQRFVSLRRFRGYRETGLRPADHSLRAISAGVSSAVSAHRSAWAARWDKADVQVEGDEELQRALRFAIYHLISAANPEDSFSSIGARALTGRAYKGHVFWDTEIYMLPFFIATCPASARALLAYRYHTLPAAREKARKAGYRGAMYAWESADTGEEVTPESVVTPMGEVVSIRNGEMEVHITADIAYGVWQYWQNTGDVEFLLKCGAEIILDAARFWASRGELEPDGRFHIRHVIGPDEYHEDVDDNAFTNLMAAWNMKCAVEVARVLEPRWSESWRELKGRLNLTDSEIARWPHLASVMVTGFHPESLLFEQFEGYFQKEQIDLREYEPRTTAMDLVLGSERVQGSNIVKQPDVVMAIQLLWDEFSPEVREANFAYYEPRTAHGSSLSPSTHALVAARLGKMDLAERYLRQAAEIDLGNNMGNAALGVHAAAIGGLWQAVVLGFAGLRSGSESILLSPNLPLHWRRLGFPFEWRNRRLQISMAPDRVQVKVAGEDAVPIRIECGEDFAALPDQEYAATRRQGGWGTWLRK